jgi:aldehyde dehydrogenase (NAD+)
VEALMKQSGHPLHLRDIGVKEEVLAMAPYHAIADTPTLFNARPVTEPGQVAALYKEIF